jgi:hypothetical protein
VQRHRPQPAAVASIIAEVLNREQAKRCGSLDRALAGQAHDVGARSHFFAPEPCAQVDERKIHLVVSALFFWLARHLLLCNTRPRGARMNVKAKQKLVLIGNGMAGVRTLEELLKLAPDLYDITVFGAEPHPNYNRILLSPVLAGEQTIEQIVLNDWDWYHDNGITLHTGKKIVKKAAVDLRQFAPIKAVFVEESA